MGGRSLILLDTHVLIWLDQDSSSLGATARKVANDGLRQEQLAVSAISFWEIAMLVIKGRIEIDRPVESWRRDFLKSGLIEVPISGEIAVMAASLEGINADPADRMIAATAIQNGARLITADKKILKWQSNLERQDARL